VEHATCVGAVEVASPFGYQVEVGRPLHSLDAGGRGPEGYSAHFWHQDRVWHGGRREQRLDAVPCRVPLALDAGTTRSTQVHTWATLRRHQQFHGRAHDVPSDHDDHDGSGGSVSLGAVYTSCLGVTMGRGPAVLPHQPAEPLLARDFLALKAAKKALQEDTQRLRASLHFVDLEAALGVQSDDARHDASRPQMLALPDGSNLTVTYVGSLYAHPAAVIHREDVIDAAQGAWLSTGPEGRVARVSWEGVEAPLPAYDVEVVVEREAVRLPPALVQGLGHASASILSHNAIGRLFVNGENVSHAREGGGDNGRGGVGVGCRVCILFLEQVTVWKLQPLAAHAHISTLYGYSRPIPTIAVCLACPSGGPGELVSRQHVPTSAHPFVPCSTCCR
jgi:hypothetical protein